jgi:hypothetical protein
MAATAGLRACARPGVGATAWGRLVFLFIPLLLAKIFSRGELVFYHTFGGMTNEPRAKFGFRKVKSKKLKVKRVAKWF